MKPYSRRAVLMGAGVAGAGVGLAVAGPASASPSGVGDTWSAATYADVVGSRISKEYSVVRTEGYHSPGDGGGALYRRLDADPANPDRWHLRSLDGSWWELAETVVSVKALGAAGDWDEAAGTGSDDTAAFQAATRLDRAVYVPGTPLAYKVTDSIRLTRDGADWYGDGYRSRIVLYSIDTGAGQLLGIGGEPPDTPDGPPRRVVRGVRVSGLHLDTRNTRNNNGLGGSFAADVQVADMYFSRIGRKALTFQYHVSNVRCRDITVYGAVGEPGSTQSAISVEGQTAGVDLRYLGGVASTADLGGADMHDLSFVNVSCASSGYNYIVVSNAHRVLFDTVTLGDTQGAGSFVIFTRKVWESHLRRIRGGDSKRRMLFFDASVENCSAEDFEFGATTGTASDGRAITCAGAHNRFRGGSFQHRNTAAQEAIYVTAADVQLADLYVPACVSTWVVNGPPAAEGLSLTGCTFQTDTASAFRVKGPRALVDGNRFLTAGAPYVGRFEGPGNRCTNNYLAGAGDARLVVTADATAVVVSNVFDPAAGIDWQGASLYGSAVHSNLGLTGLHGNYLPLSGGALHMDGGGTLRVKAATFTSDTDGTALA